MSPPLRIDLRPDTADLAAQQAIERVLEAEDAARAAVEACEAQAANLVTEARQGARRIAERADARIDAMRAAARTRLAAELAGLDAEAQAAAPLPPETASRVAAAVEALAARLSGGGP